MACPPEVARRNGKLGGRKLGSATKLTRAKANELCEAGESPLDVMVDNMKFWARQSKALEEKLVVLIIDVTPPKNEEQAQLQFEQRAQLIKLLESFLSARAEAQKCAVNAAPYCHPRLQAVVFSGKTNHAVKEILDGMTEQEAAALYAEELKTLGPFA
jgi:hypothetical protein